MGMIIYPSITILLFMFHITMYLPRKEAVNLWNFFSRNFFFFKNLVHFLFKFRFRFVFFTYYMTILIIQNFILTNQKFTTQVTTLIFLLTNG